MAQQIGTFLNVLTLGTQKKNQAWYIQGDFTVRIRRKFVIMLSLKIPPHLVKCQCLKTLKAKLLKNIGQWRRRLERVVQQQGGHITHSTLDVEPAGYDI